VSSDGGQAWGAASSFYLSSQLAPVAGALAGPQLYGGGGSGAAPGTCACGAGEPVEPSTGDFYEPDTDVSIPTAGPSLSFTRTYDADLAQQEASTASPGLLGYGWSSNLSTSLLINSDYGTTTAGDETVVEANGAETLYVPASGGSCPSAPFQYQFPDGSAGTSGAFCAAPQVVASLVYNSTAATYAFTVPSGTTSTFNSSGSLKSITDRNGLVETFGYGTPNPGSGSCPSTAASCDLITAAGGRTLTIALDSEGRVIKVIEPNGGVWNYQYSAADDLTQVTDAAGDVTTYTYDSSNANTSLQHDLLTITDPNGQPGGPDAGAHLANVYNASGQVTSQTDPAGLVTSFNYSAMNVSSATGLTVVTDGTGSETAYGYFDGLLMTKTTGYGAAAAGTWQYEYDPNTLLPIETFDPDGNLTAETYNANGDALTVTDGNRDTTTYTYNGFGEVLTEFPPIGAETVNTYDADGDLQTSTVEGSAVTGNPAPNLETQYAYLDSSLPADPTSVTDPDGDVTTLTYDVAGQVATNSVSPSTGVSNTTTYLYDTNGQLYCEAGPKATDAGVSCPAFGQPRVADTTTYSRDADERVISTTDPDGNANSTQYDADGNAILTTDGNGNETKSSYDADDRLSSEVVGYGGTTPATTSYLYDVAPGSGACSSSVSGATYCDTTTDPDSNVTVDYYNAGHEMIEEIRPGGITTSYTYDAAGNKLTMTDATGRTTYYGYDQDNQLTWIQYSDGKTPDVAYSFNGVGQRTSMTDGTGTTSYTYDGDGRLISVTDGANVSVTYGYDDDDNVTCISYPGATTACADSGQTSGTDLVNRTYDSAGELHTSTDWNGNETTFDYDADGNLTATIYPNGDTVTSGFDDGNQLQSTDVAPTAEPSSPLASIAYVTDADSLITKETDTGALSGTTTDGYDDNERLDAVNSSDLTYDAAGNLTKLQDSATEDVNAGEEVTSSLNGSQTTSYGYDALGERTSMTSPTGSVVDYGYDQAGRLVSVSTASALQGKVSTSADHSLVVSSADTVSAFGTNTYGEIGNSTTTTATTPVTLSAPTGVVEVAAGKDFSLALTSSGAVYSWGENNDGQLGLGTTTNESSPQEVTSLSHVVSIAAGESYALALTSSGTVYAWGYDNDGQLGNDTTTTEESPVEITSLSGVAGIAAGESHALAFTTAGGVYSWGLNTYGQLGNDTTTTEKTPVSVSGLSSIVGLAAGADHSVAVTSSGAVYAWGENNDGQLGNGTTTNEKTPVAITGVSGVTAIAAEADHTVALTAAGTVYAWGLNSSHQLGTGTTTEEESPMALSTSALSTVASGSTANSSLALGPSGVVWEWGSNGSYQLGTGATTDLHTPTALSSVSSAVFEANTYNGDGLRMSEQTSSGTASFTWNTVAPTAQMLSDGTTDYIYGPDGLIEQTASSTTSYYFLDALGSTRALLSSSGAVSATFSFTAYGTLAGSSGSATTPFLYAGAYYDSVSGQYYLVHRSYDPTTGQFVSVDPLVDMTGQAYSYADDDPINTSDPSGMCSWLCWGGLALGVLALATGVGAAVGVEIIVGDVAVDAGTLGVTSMLASAGGATADYPGCFEQGDSTACTGFALNAASFGVLG
jgi:RHS repeat-associated protein